MSKTRNTNPFRAMPFPAAGGAYRIDGGRMKPDVAQPVPADAPEAATDPAEPETDTGETAPPRIPRHRNTR